MSEPTDLLSVEALTVRYGSFTAVKDMTMRVEPGQIVGLIGPNGAGKSTVINAVSGAVAADHRARCSYRGRPRPRVSGWTSSRCEGMVRTFQNLEVFPTMTVLENVLIRVEASPAPARTSPAPSASTSASTSSTPSA